MKAKCLYHSKNILGECPVWSVKEQALYWIDIEINTIYILHIETNSFREIKLEHKIGSFAFTINDNEIVAALDIGFAYVNLSTKSISPIVNPLKNKTNMRFNDGKCDRKGRFWAGSLDNNFDKPVGVLYRLDNNETINNFKEAVICSNGIGWSPDNKTMYYTDSFRYCIYAYDFDIEMGTITNERIFALDTDGSEPDGLTVDVEGFVWSVKWSTGRVVRYAPDGNIDQTIKLPVQQPTSCTFGGPAMNQLFITSARMDLSAQQLLQQPLAGSVLVLETDTKGLEDSFFIKI
ncbi:MAG: SMP-30/gluconolactonase/LRE family protein [Chitinophagales bacterium]